MTRTFIALEMNESLQRHLEGVIHQMAQALPSVRPVDPAGIHLTLAFLGELPDAQLAQAMEASQYAAQHMHGFTYRLSRLGVFGNMHQPRVIWMGIDEPSGALMNTHRIVNQHLTERGFTLETRPFSPHFTLARLKAPLPPLEQQRLQDLLAGKQSGLTSSQTYSARQLDVVKSELLKTGARYTVLHSYPLAEREP